ncbi:hypothetical protein [Paenibacillus sp. OV219]|uniref:hypothetical protein n=1 Tax=Paenibacillus sp. OV219 TaxID=1884377 RepID=UPI0008C9119E|nr:hypothetical protein [Paenibacillus sp. OV219]SEN96277.1 hypothetical protein SAMN05518847_10579 [Paenibacillus sp. OV219]
MTRLLDSKTSQNASYANSISIPIILISLPQIIAQQTLNLSTGAANFTTVSFSGTVVLQVGPQQPATNILITVIRGLTTSGVSVFSASRNLNINLLGPQVISFSGSDFNAPNTANVAYTVFIQASLVGVTRVGPESVNFTAVSEV